MARPDVPSSTVFVVDDDAAVARSLRRLLESAGLPVETYSSAEARAPGCRSRSTPSTGSR